MPLEYEKPRERIRRRGSWISLIGMGIGSFLATVAYLVGSIYIGSMASIANGFLFFVLAGLVLVVVSRSAQIMRRRRAIMVLSYVHKIVQAHLPIVTMLQATAESEQGDVRHRLLKLADECNAGVSVADALAFAVPDLEAHTLAMIRAGDAHGDMESALSRAIVQQNRRWSTLPMQSAQRFYMLLVMSAIITIVSLLIIFVFPRVRSILRDFQVPTPLSTQIVMESADALAAVPLLSMLMWCVVLCVAVNAMARLISGRVELLPYWFSNSFKRLLWHLPVLGRAMRDGAMADFCTVLSQAAQAKVPLPRAVLDAGFTQDSPVLRRHATSWAHELEQGHSIVDAARLAGFPAVVSSLAGASARVGELPRAMAYLARYYDSRFSASSLMLRYVGGVLFTLLAGAVVGLLGLAIFQPMQAAVNHIALWVQGM